MPIPGLVPAGIKAGASLLGGLFGSDAEEEAARARAAAYDTAIGEVGNAYNDAQEYLDPRLSQEGVAMGRVNSLLGLGGEAPDYSTFRGTPGYDFQQEEAARAIERSAAARGGLASGNTLAALSDRSQSIADTTFNNYLAQVMGLQNQGADFASAGLSTDRGNRLAELELGKGGARASGIEGEANQWLDAFGGAADAAGGYFGENTLPKYSGPPPINGGSVVKPFEWDWSSTSNWGR